jgi:hypothetical protein
VAAEPSDVDEQRREALDLPVDRDVVDLDAAFDEQLLDITLGEVVAEVPPDGYHDHVGRVPEPGESRTRWRLCAGSGGELHLSKPAPIVRSANATDLDTATRQTPRIPRRRRCAARRRVAHPRASSKVRGNPIGGLPFEIAVAPSVNPGLTGS